MADTDYTPYLKGFDDWDVWNRWFIAKAVAARLWDQINPETRKPPTKKPQEPDLHNYPVSAAFLERISPERCKDEPTCDGVAPQGVEISSRDLTSDGFESFAIDWKIYKHLCDVYDDERDRINDLRREVRKTVTPHIFSICCEPTESLHDWYSKIKEYTGLTKNQLARMARKQYRTATEILTEMPENVEMWLQSWERAMANAETHQLFESQSPSVWAVDFFDAVQQVFPDWTRIARYTYRQKIDDDTLRYQELASDFRRELRTYPPNLPTSKVSKGPFRPAFGRSVEKKRKRESKKCQACHRPHPTSRCYYLFPSRAPESFTPIKAIQKKADKWAKKNPTEYEEAKTAYQTPSKRGRAAQPDTE